MGGGGDTEPPGETRRRKPTGEVCSSAPERSKNGGRWPDLISQLEAMIGWEPHARK